jgi:photosystem II stability/assembly factor-like uncharacterized protein
MRSAKLAALALSVLLAGTVLAGDTRPVAAGHAASGAWETLRGPSASLIDVDFVGLASGWAVGAGGTILHTSDGGTTWTAQASGTTGGLLGVDFADTANGCVTIPLTQGNSYDILFA